MEIIPYEECRAKTTADGKPGIGVLQHCRHVAKVAKALAAVAHPAVKTILGTNPGAVAAVHDNGKISPGFQKKYFNEHLKRCYPVLASMSNANFETDHTLIGAAAIRRYLMSPFSVSAYAEIVGAHHGRGHQSIPRTDEGGKFGGKPWAQERHRFIERLAEEFGPLPEEPPDPAKRNVLAGLVTIADWIGSDETFFPPEGLPSYTDLDKKAADAAEKCGFKIPDIMPGLSFETVFGFPPYPIQKTFIDCIDGPGLYILEAPMGIGKTEAALYGAYLLMTEGHNRGFYFGLPTRLTSDKIHERVTDFLKTVCKDETGPLLAHGHAWMRAFENGGKGFSAGADWFSPRKRKLLFPFGVGTIDQALMSVLRVKHFFIRAFALAGKVVILDEVHSYDVYTGSLMEWMIRQLLEIGCTVIVLSATLTGDRRSRLFSKNASPVDNSNYPLITCEKAGKIEAFAGSSGKNRTYGIRIMDLSDADMAAIAVEKAEKGHCVLCIANTVARAQNWYKAVAQKMIEARFSIGLIHSRFPAFRRDELETEWIAKLGKNGNRPGGCVLVGTQVLEQSLDIDADFLITELAPTDMVLQRMGRQWRHSRKNRPSEAPETIIVSGDPQSTPNPESIIEAFGKSNCHVYMPYVLWRSLQTLKSRSEILLPANIRDLLEATYSADGKREPEPVLRLREMLEKRLANLRQFANAARSDVKSLGVLEDREGVSTRYSEMPTADALLVTSVDSTGYKAVIEPIDGQGPVSLNAFQRDFGATVRLHRNLVSMPAWHLEKLGGIQKPEWLNKHFYEPVAVLLQDPLTGALTFDGKPSGYTYDPLRGLMRVDGRIARDLPRNPVEDYDDLNAFDITLHEW